jgi:hypothetical protein
MVAEIIGHKISNLTLTNFGNQIRSRVLSKKMLLCNKVDSSVVFCIVHWNAPDILLLNINQIKLLHPEFKIYVLDNGSKQTNVAIVQKGLEKFDNVTLFALKECPTWAERVGLDHIFDWYSHTYGLQFLLNFSAEQQDKFAVFLDQDCLLSSRIDDLLDKFSQKITVVGARDYVAIPRNFGPLKKGILRYSCDLVHPSFMILQPERIKKLFGNLSLYDARTRDPSFYYMNATPEPYHGLSFKASGRILFLDAKMDDSIPFLTSYSYSNKTYAWHAWYSSRTTGLSPQATIDGLPASWLIESWKQRYEFFKQLHEDTIQEMLVPNQN